MPQPFNPDASCPKCGGKDLGIQWHEGNHWGCQYWDEHLDRYCRTCGYKWAEKPLDKASTTFGTYIDPKLLA